MGIVHSWSDHVENTDKSVTLFSILYGLQFVLGMWWILHNSTVGTTLSLDNSLVQLLLFFLFETVFVMILYRAISYADHLLLIIKKLDENSMLQKDQITKNLIKSRVYSSSPAVIQAGVSDGFSDEKLWVEVMSGRYFGVMLVEMDDLSNDPANPREWTYIEESARGDKKCALCRRDSSAHRVVLCDSRKPVIHRSSSQPVCTECIEMTLEDILQYVDENMADADIISRII